MRSALVGIAALFVIVGWGLDFNIILVIQAVNTALTGCPA